MLLDLPMSCHGFQRRAAPANIKARTALVDLIVMPISFIVHWDMVRDTVKATPITNGAGSIRFADLCT